jgi:ParB-like chromosome segregation protein Spo0J
MTTTEMKLRKVPYEELTLGTELGFVNPRTVTGLSNKEIAELASSIEAEGLKDELVVWPYEKDKVTYNIVLRGQRRYLAIGKLLVEGKANGLGEGIPVKPVHCSSMAEAEIEALVDVVHGAGLSTPEQAEALERLKASGLTQKEVAKKLGKSETWVSRIGGAYHKAVPELREAWRMGKVPDESAKGLAEVPREHQAEAVKEFLDTRGDGKREDKAKARAKVAKETEKELGDVLGAAPGRLGLLGLRLALGLETVTQVAAGKPSPEIEAMRLTLAWVLGTVGDAKLPKTYLDALKRREAEEAAKPKMGDEVKWAYQVNGKQLTRIGVVVEIVPKGKLPKTDVRTSSTPRTWDSYVIQDKDGENFYPIPGIVEKL